MRTDESDGNMSRGQDILNYAAAHDIVILEY